MASKDLLPILYAISSSSKLSLAVQKPVNFVRTHVPIAVTVSQEPGVPSRVLACADSIKGFPCFVL